MVDLGKYTATVIGAYGVTIALLAILVWVSVAQGRRMATRLRAQERQSKQDG
jgi:heme exporter protein D